MIFFQHHNFQNKFNLLNKIVGSSTSNYFSKISIKASLINGYDNVGGLIGQALSGNILEYCYNLGSSVDEIIVNCNTKCGGKSKKKKIKKTLN